MDESEVDSESLILIRGFVMYKSTHFTVEATAITGQFVSVKILILQLNYTIIHARW